MMGKRFGRSRLLSRSMSGATALVHAEDARMWMPETWYLFARECTTCWSSMSEEQSEAEANAGTGCPLLVPCPGLSLLPSLAMRSCVLQDREQVSSAESESE